MEPPPLCSWCCEEDLSTVRHILVECPALRAIRRRYFDMEDDEEMILEAVISDNVPHKNLCDFLIFVGVYEEL